MASHTTKLFPKTTGHKNTFFLSSWRTIMTQNSVTCVSNCWACKPWCWGTKTVLRHCWEKRIKPSASKSKKLTSWKNQINQPLQAWLMHHLTQLLFQSQVWVQSLLEDLWESMEALDNTKKTEKKSDNTWGAPPWSVMNPAARQARQDSMSTVQRIAVLVRVPYQGL